MIEKKRLNQYLARRIRCIRLEHKFTQKHVAESIGIKVRAYSHYETGDREISIYTVFLLSEFYNVDINEIVQNFNY